jgi:hypothetical protein|tara:strand:- start:154 stop:324 length:171 start_codon:yes stop_codon:yes gene_type:complete
MEKQNANVALTESQINAVINALDRTTFYGDDKGTFREAILDQLNKAFDHRETLFDM